MLQRLASNLLIPLALAFLLPSIGWSRPVKAATSSQNIESEPEFDETIVQIQRPTVIGNFYVLPGSYVATVNENFMQLDNRNHGLVALAIVSREEAHHTFKTTKEDVKAGNLKKLDLSGTREAVLIQKPNFAAS